MKKQRKKSASAMTLIHGSDGPTAYFVTGTDRKKREKYQKKYEKKQERIIAKLKTSSHTIDELISYAKEQYGARRISEQSRKYKGEKENLKYMLVEKYHPELITVQKPEKPASFVKEEDIRNYLEQIEHRYHQAVLIPEDEFPLDFQLYKIILKNKRYKAEVHICVEYKYHIMDVSHTCAGKTRGKELRKMERDLYLYYGVNKKDIQNRSERLTNLVAILSAR